MRTGKPPVIVIPGILGSELINTRTGEKVWPSAFRTSEEGLPMTPNLAANRDDLVPGKIIETVRLARAGDPLRGRPHRVLAGARTL